MRINPGYGLGILIVAIGAGLGLGSLIKKTPSVLIVHCPDGFEIEIHGEFDLKTGHRMRFIFCDQLDSTNDSSDPLKTGSTSEFEPNSS